jgi:hypothetical protein
MATGVYSSGCYPIPVPVRQNFTRTRARVENFTHTRTRAGKNTRRVTHTRIHTRYKPKEHEYIILLESYIVNTLSIEINNYNIATKIHYLAV